MATQKKKTSRVIRILRQITYKYSLKDKFIKQHASKATE